MSSSDVSAVTKYFSTAAEGFNTTLGSTISASATSVPLNSTSGLTNGNVFVGIIEPGATNQQTFTGTVDISGSQITNVVWVRGTNVGHAGGVTIVDYVSGASHNMMTAGILKQHSQTGAHVGLTNTGGMTTDSLTVTGNETVGGTFGVTGATTLTGPIGGPGYDAKTIANSYKFSVYRNAAWTDGNGAYALITFDTKLFDTGPNYSVSTGKFTAPVNGFYFFSAASYRNVGAGAQGAVALYKNGSQILQGTNWESATTVNAASIVGGVIQLAANDFIQVESFGNGGAGVTGQSSTYFHGFLVSVT